MKTWKKVLWGCILVVAGLGVLDFFQPQLVGTYLPWVHGFFQHVYAIFVNTVIGLFPGGHA
jgi:hypothetical protein